MANLSITIPGEQQTLDYLVAEALSHQPHDVQAWLLKTSILDRFCAPLCEAVCISPEESEPSNLNGDGFIRWLTERNLFVIPQDHHGHWYRYHNLFQELLQSQLENALDADEIAALYARANRWLEENGLIDQATRYAADSGDKILAAFSAPVLSDQTDLGDPLTERERQVLKTAGYHAQRRGNRGAAGSERQHGAHAHQEYLQQTRCPQPDGGNRARC